jgi:hypothetical protein
VRDQQDEAAVREAGSHRDLDEESGRSELVEMGQLGMKNKERMPSRMAPGLSGSWLEQLGSWWMYTHLG